MVLLLTPGEMLARGLTLVGFPEEKQRSVRLQKNLERWSTHFQGNPVVYAVLWEDLQRTWLDDVRVDNATYKDLDYFLMAIYYLANYDEENKMESRFGWSDRTVRHYVWDVWLPKIAGLKEEKIIWPARWSPGEDEGKPETIFIVTADGVHCEVQEPQHGEFSKDREYWSHKFGSAGLNYEIAISIYEQRVVWINGPFKAGKHTDIKVFRAALKKKIPKGKLVVADLGYRGEAKRIAVPNSHDSDEVRVFKSRILARHESFNGKIKKFSILSERFRHGVVKHQIAFNSCCVIGQYMIENGSPLMDN